MKKYTYIRLYGWTEWYNLVLSDNILSLSKFMYYCDSTLESIINVNISLLL